MNATIAKAAGTAQITDDDPLPSRSISNQAFGEGAGASYRGFPVLLSAPSSKTIQVQCTVTGGSATAADVILSSTTLFFGPGEVFRDCAVTMLGDQAIEPDETFTVTLSAPVGATLGQATATGTIINDD